MKTVTGSRFLQKETAMEFLQNPNITYLLLAGGLVFAMLALAAPGTGVLEIVALFVLGLAGWSVASNNLPINAWSLVVLGVGLVLFFLALRRPKQWYLLVASILAIVLGSVFLFRSQIWYIPAVDPFLAAIVSVLTGGFFWVAARKVMEAASVRPVHDLDALVGAKGEAKTHIFKEGSVQVEGELWSARSDQPIHSGTAVRVLELDGFTLKVEAAEPNHTDH
jgi:membrane-bound serine protease (ClpP class)